MSKRSKLIPAGWAAFLLLAICVRGMTAAESTERPAERLSAVEREFAATGSRMFQGFCFDCHGDKKTKARLNLQQMSGTPDFAGDFKSWEKVIAMLEEREMPPEDEGQPSSEERAKMIEAVRGALDGFVRREAGDPGRIVMRQLTSAEYGYTIQDLTGLELGLERNFVSDAVGGEGFSNVGEVQFIQDSTLERYLDAAKIVASHAVIGAGPLRFYRSPGKTGQELAAMARIQEIYRRHGFRTTAGEGGEAFGLEVYPKAFYAAWRFQHRKELGLDSESTTLGVLAKEEGIQPRFVEYVWNLINEPGLSFPSSEIAAAFRKLPTPNADEKQAERVRAECEKVFKLQEQWQGTFAENMGDAEGPTAANFRPSLTNSFRVRLSWPAGTTNAAFTLSVSEISGDASRPVVRWKEPTLRFRQRGDGAAGRRGQRGKPLREFVTESTARLLDFGRGGDTAIGPGDFVTAGTKTVVVEFAIPTGMTQAELMLHAELDVTGGDDSVIRCVLSHDLNEGATIASTGAFSVLLANPKGAGVEMLKVGVADFALNFPQNSHREAAPSDRDPIPAPFDNSYNNSERNDFHYIIKYHRDDLFLTENILDEATRRELDHAWADLLGSFDYHDTFLKFVTTKYKVDLGDRSIAKLTGDWIDKLPSEPRTFVKGLHTEYLAMQRTFESAESVHMADVLRFARLAWRRPLKGDEEERLRSFYAGLRKESKHGHAEAVRAVLARVLVAPAFLYRVENPASNRGTEASAKRVELSGWELASRLSYFLWSSIPDAELSRAAEKGELKSPEELARQAERMLRDPRARRFAGEFFGQWFGFYRFDDYRGVDTGRFPEFTDALKAAMYDEAVSLFAHIVRNDRPVPEILFADYSFLNRDLARHYGVDLAGISTNELAMIEGVNRFRRGGLLRLGAVLTSTSAPLRTSAVKRGDWLLRRVLGRSVPPPPGDAGSIPPDDVLDDGKTVRQRLEAHRRDASCVNCHSRIDPFGFALEHFDSIGRWRETYRDGQKIDAGGTLNDGTEIVEIRRADRVSPKV